MGSTTASRGGAGAAAAVPGAAHGTHWQAVAVTGSRSGGNLKKSSGGSHSFAGGRRGSGCGRTAAAAPLGPLSSGAVKLGPAMVDTRHGVTSRVFTCRRANSAKPCPAPRPGRDDGRGGGGRGPGSGPSPQKVEPEPLTRLVLNW